MQDQRVSDGYFVANRLLLQRLTATGLVMAGAVFSATVSAQFFGNQPQPPAPVPQQQQPYPQQPQGPYSPGPQATPPGQSGRNPVCYQLEGQLNAIDRGVTDPGRAAQARQLDDAVNKLQGDLDRLVAQQRRLGCQPNSFFSIFSNQPAQCGPLGNQIEQTRSNLDRAMNDSQRYQSGGQGEQDGRRQQVLAALAQNNCGAQYGAAAAQPRGLFDNLFGGHTNYGGVDIAQGGTYTTLCVRTCDGYYYPISFATTPSRFAEDEAVCKATCPASDAALYVRKTTDDIRTATTVSGRPYTELPNAFRYRQQFDAACSCRKIGQSWADALGQFRDNSVQSGDIVVTDEKSKALSQPVQGRQPRGSQRSAPAAEQTTAPAAQPGIRSVGPQTNYPAR
jgi:hypothetical protein